MPYKDDLQAAYERISALEKEIKQLSKPKKGFTFSQCFGLMFIMSLLGLALGFSIGSYDLTNDESDPIEMSYKEKKAVISKAVGKQCKLLCSGQYSDRTDERQTLVAWSHRHYTPDSRGDGGGGSYGYVDNFMDDKVFTCLCERSYKKFDSSIRTSRRHVCALIENKYRKFLCD